MDNKKPKYDVNLSEEKINESENEYEEKLNRYKIHWRRIYINGKKSNISVSNTGIIKNVDTGKILMQSLENDYYRFSVRIEDKIQHFSVHRIVATYFCKIPKRHSKRGLTYKDLIPNHKDGIKSHNASFNLEWVTPAENSKHAWKTGLCDNIKGEGSHLSKIKEKDVIEICELLSSGMNTGEVKKYLHEKGKTYISKRQICHIRCHETWKHISCNYKFGNEEKLIPYSMDENTIHNICKLLELHKYSDTEIGAMCEVSREYVKDIRTGRRRKDISCNYNIDSNPIDRVYEFHCKML